jgi:Predicted transcriptional regulator
MPHKILRLDNVKSKTGLSRSTIYRLTDERHFPHQINLGFRAVGWLESEVDNWLDEKISSSRS